jgi:hypothetical protein
MVIMEINLPLVTLARNWIGGLADTLEWQNTQCAPRPPQPVGPPNASLHPRAKRVGCRL